MIKSSLRDFDGSFYGQVLHIIGDFIYREEFSPLGSISLALDRAILLQTKPTFWASDNFPILWGELREHLDKETETRFFSSSSVTGTDFNFVYYKPIPIWALPHTDVERWLSGDKGDDCPVGWGSPCLAIGLAHRLGFRRVILHGCFPDESLMRWDVMKKGYIRDPKIDRTQYQGIRNMSRDFSLILGIELEDRP